MYIRLWDHMHMGMGRRMHVSRYISNVTSHFKIATELWSMYMMMAPMSGKITLSGPFFNSLLTLQPLKLVLEVHYELIRVCHLILQGGQAFHLGPDLICKAIRICGGGGMGPKGGWAGVTGAVVMRLMLLIMLCLNSDPARRSASKVSCSCRSSASMVASWTSRGRMDGSAGVVVEPGVEPVAVAADAVVALSSKT